MVRTEGIWTTWWRKVISLMYFSSIIFASLWSGSQIHLFMGWAWYAIGSDPTALRMGQVLNSISYFRRLPCTFLLLSAINFLSFGPIKIAYQWAWRCDLAFQPSRSRCRWLPFLNHVWLIRYWVRRRREWWSLGSILYLWSIRWSIGDHYLFQPP